MSLSFRKVQLFGYCLILAIFVGIGWFFLTYSFSPEDSTYSESDPSGPAPQLNPSEEVAKDETQPAPEAPQHLESLAITNAQPADKMLPDHVIREESRHLSPDFQTLGQEFEQGNLEEIEFPLFDGETIVLTNLRHDRLSEDSGIFKAKIAGESAHAHAMLSYVRNAVAGDIHLPNRGHTYEIRNAKGQNISTLSLIDPDKFQPCALCKAGTQASFH